MIIKPVIDKRPRKDGTHCVKVSVCHNGSTRYIPTDIHCLPAEFSNGRIIKRVDGALLNSRLQRQILSISEAVDKIEYTGCLSCKELVSLISDYTTIKNPTITDTYSLWCARLACSEASKVIYAERYNHLVRFISKDTRLQNITTETLNKLTRDMTKAGYSDNTIRMDMSLLRSLLTLARNRGEITSRSPFIGYRTPRVVVRDNWVSREFVREMGTYVLPKEAERFTRDMFLLSYYLGGMNQVDLFHIPFTSTTISYIRTKTMRQNKAKSRVEFSIHPKAIEIIDRWKNSDGYLVPPCKGKGWSTWVNCQLSSIKQVYGGSYTFGAARKSIAEHLFESGCPTSVIDYLLGHSIKQGTNCLYRYIKVTPTLATEWLWKMIDMV